MLCMQGTQENTVNSLLPAEQQFLPDDPDGGARGRGSRGRWYRADSPACL